MNSIHGLTALGDSLMAIQRRGYSICAGHRLLATQAHLGEPPSEVILIPINGTLSLELFYYRTMGKLSTFTP
jgi:hypothetical protein